MTITQPHSALSHRCPFCHADPGQACRSHRGRGHELNHPHSRRIAATRPIEERQPTPRIKALCCTCGNLRTVNADYSRHQDPNHAESPRGKAEGWRKTESLKCDVCEERTRHALLHRTDGRFQDWDERQQLIALGDDDDSKYPSSDEYIARLRREYRELFPRNPFLRHRWWTKEAKEAWANGTKTVIALCGEPMTVDYDPNEPSEEKETAGKIVAKQVSDTEYEDPETGLWWIDMSCVDCCRVSNKHHWAGQRRYLEELLAWFAARPETIDDDQVAPLVAVLKDVYQRTREDHG